jgi:hypothetical protein
MKDKGAYEYFFYLKMSQALYCYNLNVFGISLELHSDLA